MEDAAADLERRMEATAEAAEISDREIKEAAEEAEVKGSATTAAVAKANNFVSSAGTLSAVTVAYTDTSAFMRAPTYTILSTTVRNHDYDAYPRPPG